MNEVTPFSPEQQATLDEARERRRIFSRTERIATLNLWTIGLFGGLTVLWGLVSGGSGLLVGVALLAVAWNERRGRDRLRALDLRGPLILGRNQLVLAGVVGVYCLWAIRRTRMAPDPSMQQLEELAGIPTDLVADLTAAVYGVVLVVVGVIQLLLARYHFRRGPMLAAFRSTTPTWVIDLLAESNR